MAKAEKPSNGDRDRQKGRLEKTPYRGVYKRISSEGKVTGYAIKPRFGGYVGKGQTFNRLTDARTAMERLRTEVKDGRLRGNGRKTLLQAIEKYLVEEVPSARRHRAAKPQTTARLDRGPSAPAPPEVEGFLAL